MRVIVEVQKKVDAFTNCHAEKKYIYIMCDIDIYVVQIHRQSEISLIGKFDIEVRKSRYFNILPSREFNRLTATFTYTWEQSHTWKEINYHFV